MSRIRRPDTSARNTVYGPPVETGAEDMPTISRDEYDMGSGSREGLGIGRTGGYAGPTFRGDDFRISAGLGKRGSVGVGAKLGFKKGGKAKKMAKGGSASKRADGCAIKGKTKGRMV